MTDEAVESMQRAQRVSIELQKHLHLGAQHQIHITAAHQDTFFGDIAKDVDVPEQTPRSLWLFLMNN